MIIIYSLIKLLFAFAHEDVGHHIAMALMALLGGLVFIVLPVYIIGKLVDKFKKENTERVLDVQLSSVKENEKRELVHQDNVAERERLSNKYEEFRDTIASEVKKTLKTKEEIKILESQSRLPYTELIKLGSPGQLTDQGLAVYEILIKEINKAFLKKFSFV